MAEETEEEGVLPPSVDTDTPLERLPKLEAALGGPEASPVNASTGQPRAAFALGSERSALGEGGGCAPDLHCFTLDHMCAGPESPILTER